MDGLFPGDRTTQAITRLPRLTFEDAIRMQPEVRGLLAQRLEVLWDYASRDQALGGDLKHDHRRLEFGAKILEVQARLFLLHKVPYAELREEVEAVTARSRDVAAIEGSLAELEAKRNQ